MLKLMELLDDQKFSKALTCFLAICVVLSSSMVVYAVEADSETTINEIAINVAEYSDDIGVVAYYESNQDAVGVEVEFAEMSKVVIDEVPLYNQCDYAHVPYGIDSVATDGCGIVCAAMVAAYFNDTEVSPADLALMFNDHSISNMELMEQALEYYNVPIQRRISNSDNWKVVCEALRNDQIVISLQGNGLFTRVGHFIVLTGFTEDGKIMVNDPYGYNWNKSEVMVDGYANGFSEHQVLSTGGTYWIFEKK